MKEFVKNVVFLHKDEVPTIHWKVICGLRVTHSTQNFLEVMISDSPESDQKNDTTPKSIGQKTTKLFIISSLSNLW